MKVGDYVRTKKGIAKIEGQNDSVRFTYPCAWITDTYLEINDDTEYLYDEDIIKSSPNIIDLIEVGDYVNGNKIVHIQEEEFPNYPKRLLFAGVDENNIDDVWEVYNKDDIKSIVTKEAFEHMEYRIGK